MNKKKELMLLIVGLVCLVLITVGVTYAFFNYAKEGTTDNTITTGTITFLYTEISEVGRGISIEDAYPVSDSVGKAQIGEGKVFDFKVTSNTPNSSSISYEVTARKKDTSTLSEDAVKLYLTKVTGTTEEEVILAKYSELTTTDKVDSTKYNEKTLYKGKVPANTTDYEQAFRLRMWIDEDVDFSDGTTNDKGFTVTVNVYANAKVVTADEEELLQNTNITTITINGEEFTKVTNQTYDYQVELTPGITEANIKIVTENEYATVEVEKIDNLAYNTNVKRLSAIKNLSLTSGDNYFKITVTSENKENKKEYKLKVVVPKDTDNTLSSLSVSNCPLNETFSSNTTEYTCTMENDDTTTTVSATKTSNLASIEGLGQKELITGENTVTITVTSESGEEKIYTIVITKPAKSVLLKDAIFAKYTTIYDNPTLTTSSNNTEDPDGLYISYDTNKDENGEYPPTYYFRGAIDNNYVDFAGFTWRIVRINEDGTIRLINAESIGKLSYPNSNNVKYMYYSNSDAKTTLETWYSDKIASNNNYLNKVATGNYYCEQAKVAYNKTTATNSGTDMVVYTEYDEPNFKCEPDANYYGLVNASIGLITYDEVLHAGGYYVQNPNYYLYFDGAFYTMSPAGFNGTTYAAPWHVTTGYLRANFNSVSQYQIRPVINLKADVKVTGSGSSDDHWVVQS